MSPAAPIPVFLISLPLVGAGLARLVEQGTPPMTVVGMGTVAECLPLVRAQSACVVVFDAEADDSIDAVADLAAQGSAKVLVLTGSTGPDGHDQVILLGARGVVNKREAPHNLRKAIERVYAGELWMDRDATGRIFMQLVRNKAEQAQDPTQQKIASLTPRERAIVEAVASDAAAPGKQLAARLAMGENTLRNHLTSIYGKLELRNRMDLYAFAHRHKLVSTDTLSA